MATTQTQTDDQELAPLCELSIEDFSGSMTATFDRLKRTGEAELLTDNGEPRAVIMSPALFSHLCGERLTATEIAAMRESIRQVEAGHVMTVNEAFDSIRAELLAKYPEAAGRPE